MEGDGISFHSSDKLSCKIDWNGIMIKGQICVFSKHGKIEF